MGMKNYEILIVGGGLAGLSLAILCAKSDLKVLLIEKGIYPRQKVCGEYISMESYDFIKELGVPLEELEVPIIKKFILTNPFNKEATTQMSVGGFGISRYYLDEKLAQLALQAGVEILTETKAQKIEPLEKGFRVTTQKGEVVASEWVVGAYGRISGFEPKQFVSNNEFIGVKYHIDKGPADDTIEIHSFKGGYCGVSKVEKGKYNLCYLARAFDFKECKGNIDLFEQYMKSQNPFLAERLSANKLFDPVFTSKLYFGVHEDPKVNYPQVGDAAGFIPPLTGNGMSLAFRSAKHLHQQIIANMNHPDPAVLLKANQDYISKYLKKRINKGILLQHLLLSAHPMFQKMLFGAFRTFPSLLNQMTKQAVGDKI